MMKIMCIISVSYTHLDVYKRQVPDGTMIFPNEPIMTIKAPIIEAQILETALLTCFNTGSLTDVSIIFSDFFR